MMTVLPSTAIDRTAPGAKGAKGNVAPVRGFTAPTPCRGRPLSAKAAPLPTKTAPLPEAMEVTLTLLTARNPGRSAPVAVSQPAMRADGI